MMSLRRKLMSEPGRNVSYGRGWLDGRNGCRPDPNRGVVALLGLCSFMALLALDGGAVASCLGMGGMFVVGLATEAAAEASEAFEVAEAAEITAEPSEA